MTAQEKRPGPSTDELSEAMDHVIALMRGAPEDPRTIQEIARMIVYAIFHLQEVDEAVKTCAANLTAIRENQGALLKALAELRPPIINVVTPRDEPRH